MFRELIANASVIREPTRYGYVGARASQAENASSILVAGSTLHFVASTVEDVANTDVGFHYHLPLVAPAHDNWVSHECRQDPRVDRTGTCPMHVIKVVASTEFRDE